MPDQRIIGNEDGWPERMMMGGGMRSVEYYYLMAAADTKYLFKIIVLPMGDKIRLIDGGLLLIAPPNIMNGR